MVDIYATYAGDLRCKAQHGPSGSTLLTDAPIDNMGKGEAFSPTDLVATALGTCILTTMAIVAERNGIPFGEAKIHVVKEMTIAPPRRIAKLKVHIDMPAGLSSESRTKLEHTAHACPVHRSLHPDVEVPVEFVYPD
jgi:putative redox protein